MNYYSWRAKPTASMEPFILFFRRGKSSIDFELFPGQKEIVEKATWFRF
jgi:hypothetical protein